MKSGPFISCSQAETEELGRRLAESLEPPALVLLEGSLGAGKTAITRGLVDGLGCPDPSPVHSPTFSLVNEYQCRAGLVYHVDLYRLDTPQALYSIGLEEILGADAIVIVEWAEKLLWQVEHTVRIKLEVTGHSNRRITIQRAGA